MTYFTYTDHIALNSCKEQDAICVADQQAARAKLLNLHKALYERMRSLHLDLHPHWQKNATVTNTTAAAGEEKDVLALRYFRSIEQAQMVEGLMGIDGLSGPTAVNPYRHPIIETRLAADHFAVELILTPDAWWDQQNLIGKLDLERHRGHMRELLRNLGGDYCFGFWDGAYLSDMHLTAWQLAQPRILDEWMATFADSQDRLRFGVWYEPQHPALSIENIVNETFERINDLYNVYEFLLWTSNNNYHSFYEKRHRHMRRLYA